MLHISREAIHHGAEILLLRDLYRSGAQPMSTPFQIAVDCADPHGLAGF